MNEPKRETPKKPPTLGETLFLCGLCIVPGTVVLLIGLGVISGNVEAGPGGRVLAVVAGLVFIFGGVMIFIRDMAGVGNKEEIPASAPLWIRLGESIVGIAILAAFALVSSVLALGPFFSADMQADMTRQMGSFGASLFRIFNGIFAIVFWYAAIYLTKQKLGKRGT